MNTAPIGSLWTSTRGMRRTVEVLLVTPQTRTDPVNPTITFSPLLDPDHISQLSTSDFYSQYQESS